MTELQAAIGRRQLHKLASWVAVRNRNASIFREVLGELTALYIPFPAKHILHAYYKFYAYTKDQAFKTDWNRDRLLHELASHGIPCGAGSCSEIYLEKAFADCDLSPQRFPIAKKLGETSLMFLVHPTLSVTEVSDIAEQVAIIVRQATR